MPSDSSGLEVTEEELFDAETDRDSFYLVIVSLVAQMLRYELPQSKVAALLEKARVDLEQSVGCNGKYDDRSLNHRNAVEMLERVRNTALWRKTIERKKREKEKAG